MEQDLLDELEILKQMNNQSFEDLFQKIEEEAEKEAIEFDRQCYEEYYNSEYEAQEYEEYEYLANDWD
jgi:DNA repair photolyase